MNEYDFSGFKGKTIKRVGNYYPKKTDSKENIYFIFDDDSYKIISIWSGYDGHDIEILDIVENDYDLAEIGLISTKEYIKRLKKKQVAEKELERKLEEDKEKALLKKLKDKYEKEA
jgi:hypothetical protein